MFHPRSLRSYTIRDGRLRPSWPDSREKPSGKAGAVHSAKAGRYLAFLEYPEEVRKHIYTTNPVESVNAGIELMRLELGGYFPSRQALEVNLFIQVVNLQDRWWKRPISTVRAKSYELLQIFTLKYELAENYETVHNFQSKSLKVGLDGLGWFMNTAIAWLSSNHWPYC